MVFMDAGLALSLGAGQDAHIDEQVCSAVLELTHSTLGFVCGGRSGIKTRLGAGLAAIGGPLHMDPAYRQ